MSYYDDGMKHRYGDKPAELVFAPDTGFVLEERWYRHNRLHRVDGPAEIIRFARTGVTAVERWYRVDDLHRTDGPAEIRRDVRTGEVVSQTYYLRGQRQSPSRSLPDNKPT